MKRIAFVLLLLPCRTGAPVVSSAFSRPVASMPLGSMFPLLPPAALQLDPWQRSLWDYRHPAAEPGETSCCPQRGICLSQVLLSSLMLSAA